MSDTDQPFDHVVYLDPHGHQTVYDASSSSQDLQRLLTVYSEEFTEQEAAVIRGWIENNQEGGAGQPTAGEHQQAKVINMMRHKLYERENK